MTGIEEFLRSIRPDQRDRFKGRNVRYHGPYVMRANGSTEDLLVEGRPESLDRGIPVLVFRMPDDPNEKINPDSVTVL